METVWFCLLSWMLATYVVLGGGDIGVGIVQPLVARNEAERAQVVRSIRPTWKGNEVWLVAAAGTMFLAFPTLFATSFSGFYLPLMLVLWLIVMRNLGIEMRHYVDDGLWKRFWDAAFSLGSLLLAVCLGAALGNVIRGVPLGRDGIFFEPLWTNFALGAQTGILDWYTVLMGLTATVALAHHGALWLATYTDADVRTRANELANVLWGILIALATVATSASFAVQPHLKASLAARPWGWFFPLIAASGIAGTIVFRRFGRPLHARLASAASLYAMMASVAVGLYPYVLPARNPALGLTAYDAAAPRSGLVVGLAWWIPGVLIACGYFFYVYSKLPETFSIHDSAD